MTHREVWALLDAFLDGSLPASQRWAVAAHLDECAACRKRVAAEARLRDIVREQLVSIETPPELSARLRASLAHAGGAARSARGAGGVTPTVMRVAALAAPALIALWLLAWVSAPAPAPEPDVPAELAVVHTLYGHDATMLDVTGDSLNVVPWFRDGYGLDLSAPRLPGYGLIGGRLTMLDGAPVAQLVYKADNGAGYLSLLRFHSTSPALNGEMAATGQLVTQVGDVTACIWPRGDDLVALVAELPPAEMVRLAASLLNPPPGGRDRSY